MNTQTNIQLRERSAVLTELMNLPHSLQGSISSFTVTSSSGKQHVYHKLQHVEGKRKINIHIPNDKLSDFEKAVENGKRAKALLAELTEIDAAEMVSHQGEALKKNSTASSRRARGA